MTTWETEPVMKGSCNVAKTISKTNFMRTLKVHTIALSLLSLIIIEGCGEQSNQVPERNTGMVPTVKESQSFKKESNAITQSLPTLMVIPSDGMLNKMGYIKKVDNQGVTSYIRDYNGLLINESDVKFIIASIEEEFAVIGYPLENLEQQLKMISYCL